MIFIRINLGCRNHSGYSKVARRTRAFTIFRQPPGVRLCRPFKILFNQTLFNRRMFLLSPCRLNCIRVCVVCEGSERSRPVPSRQIQNPLLQQKKTRQQPLNNIQEYSQNLLTGLDRPFKIYKNTGFQDLHYYCYGARRAFGVRHVFE